MNGIYKFLKKAAVFIVNKAVLILLATLLACGFVNVLCYLFGVPA